MRGGDRYGSVRHARFWARVDKSGDCWLWTGSINANGYGRISWGSGKRYAHRIAYETTAGDVPDGMCVLHRRDNPRCVRPDHLFLGTRTDNADDKVRKGRQYAKLTAATAAEIRSMYALGGLRQSDLGRMFGVTQALVSRVVRGVAW